MFQRHKQAWTRPFLGSCCPFFVSLSLFCTEGSSFPIFSDPCGNAKAKEMGKYYCDYFSLW
jgi:hypothetical protein